MANRETSPDRPGAICDKTPICVPSDPMLPKPQRAYVAISRERGARSAYMASLVKAVNATNSFWKRGVSFPSSSSSFLSYEKKGEPFRGEMETYSDDLDTDETADFDEIWTSWDTE